MNKIVNSVVSIIVGGAELYKDIMVAKAFSIDLIPGSQKGIIVKSISIALDTIGIVALPVSMKICRIYGNRS